jgi:two-component system, chemotaxis family, chemotaxis protein CheY
MQIILVVEDHRVMQRVLSYTLTRARYDIVIAQHGVEALAYLEQHDCDLVIADVAMPEMDGLTLLKRLRAQEQWRELPVIMLTASVDDSYRVSADALGVSAFLTKPTSSRELLRTVERVLADRHSA